jgi:hypothetical protein
MSRHAGTTQEAGGPRTHFFRQYLPAFAPADAALTPGSNGYAHVGGRFESSTAHAGTPLGRSLQFNGAGIGSTVA